MLIDDTDEQQEIDAYDQFVYIAKQSCSMKLIDICYFQHDQKIFPRTIVYVLIYLKKIAITYVGSWHFPIAFLFLPVNRLGIALNLSNHLLHTFIQLLNNLQQW